MHECGRQERALPHLPGGQGAGCRSAASGNRSRRRPRLLAGREAPGVLGLTTLDLGRRDARRGPTRGGEPTELVASTRQGEDDADPVWAPDGEHISFRRRVPDGTTSGNFDIFSVATDGSGDLVRLTDDPADEQDPTYSPTGSSIAYKSGAQDPKRPDNAITRTWVMDADGKKQHVLWSQGADQPQTAAAWGRR